MSGQWDNRVPNYPPPTPNSNYNSGSYAPINNNNQQQFYPPPNYPTPMSPNAYDSNQFSTPNYPLPNYPPPNHPPPINYPPPVNNNYNSGSFGSNQYSTPQYPPQFNYPPNYPPPVALQEQVYSPPTPEIQLKGEENKYRSTWIAPVANIPPKKFNIGERRPSSQVLSIPSPVVNEKKLEEEDEEDEFEYSSSSDEEPGKKVERKKSGLFSSSMSRKRSPAYILATGPLRVCGPCMAGIYCGDLPFPDGKKPKKKKMEEMISQESSKVKDKQKAEKKVSREQDKQLKNVEKERKKLEKETMKKNKEKDTKENEKKVEDEEGDFIDEEITIDKIIEEQMSQKISLDIAERDKLKVLLETADPQSPEYAKLKEELEEKELFLQVLFSAAGCDGESTAINPLLRRRDYKKGRRTRGLVKGAVITTSTTSVGVVGGAIVGGVTGFLFGFGIPGMVVGAAVGAGIGGTGGASVGLYATHSQITKKPTTCVNCKVKFKKNTPGQIPYRCRSCWLYFCDKCVPHELNTETKTFRTIAYPDDPSVLRTTNPDYEPEELFDELHIPLTHQQNKSKHRSKIKGKKLEDLSQVSKASKERKGYCSWCFQDTVHVLAEKGHITRNVWNCQGCLQRTLRCRNPSCGSMARGLVGYDEEACWKCQKKIDSWETAKLNVENLVRNGYCSWCFEFTEHDPVCDSAVIKIFKCRNCRNTTVPCSGCPKGDGFGMARDNGFFWKGKCALHSKHIEQWDDIEGNKLRSELVAFWCPYCVSQTTHIIMGPGGLLNRKTAFLCRGCHQRTYRCDKKCEDSMAKHAKKKCLRCFLEKRIMDKKPDTPTFDELLQKKEKIYIANSSREVIRANLARNSFNKEKRKATKEGYLRPFLLLVSMEPQMRVLTAATLGIDIIRRDCFGDPHAEAWEIISHHNKGIIFRTRAASEEVTKVAGSRSTWYTSLRRSMRATMKTTTFKHVSPTMTKEACKNPDINILPEMELEFLEKFGHWQHMMVTQEIHQIADQIMENKEFHNSMIPLEALGMGTPPIKRLLAEMFAEAQFSTDLQDDIINDTDAIVVSTPSLSSNTSEARSEFKNKVKHGIGSTYERKAKVVNWTAVTIPAAYVKLTVWFVIGSALALWLGPVGWAIEWGASLALGAVITAWICGEVYLGPSHEEMTPAIVLICMQRLTLAADGTDISEFMRDEDYVDDEDEVRIQEMK